MKILFALLITSILLNGQSNAFRLDYNNYRQKIYSSSLWLSGSPSINPKSSNRFIIQLDIRTIIFENYEDYLICPNIDIGLKLTKNLLLTSKSYGFKKGYDSPQIIGAGFQYYYGTRDNLDWLLSFQRVDLNGLDHFRLKSFTINLGRWIILNSVNFIVGFGMNTFKENSYINLGDNLDSMEGQINFISFDTIIPTSILNIGFETKLTNQNLLNFSIYTQKEIF